jgi:transcriptional regulator with XRE-family HTH domain
MVGVDIRIARIRAGLKQYVVAAQLGVPQTILSEIETGKRAVSPELLERILGVLGAAYSEKQILTECSK